MAPLLGDMKQPYLGTANIPCILVATNSSQTQVTMILILFLEN